MTPDLPDCVVQCAANFSEGRAARAAREIAEAACGSECVVADWSADPDHNRMVLSLLGSPQGVVAGALRSSEVAIDRIDLRLHSGVHPRLGAVDVVPFTPIRSVTLAECVDAARAFGRELCHRLGVPVYYYEAAANEGRPSSLPDIRRLAFDPMDVLQPDLIPSSAREGAGATVVGARLPLVAYNIDLATDDVIAARTIAAQIRRRRRTEPALTGVRALGLFLPSRRCAQVSMNLTRPDKTPLPVVFDHVARAAQDLGLEVESSEVIGLLQLASLDGRRPERIRLHALRSTQIIEYWTEARSHASLWASLA